MPSPVFAATKTDSAHHRLLGIALAVSGLMLGGCGGSNPTTRTNSPDLVSTPSTATFRLTLQSPVRLINVEARVIDVLTGRVLHQEVITDGDRLNVDIMVRDVPSQRLIYTEFRPVALNRSRYYDPILDGEAPFTVTLRSIVQNAANNQTILIDPYTEIAFQRAQIRSGWFTNRTETSQLGLMSVNALKAANLEVGAVFNVRTINLLQGLSSRADIQELTITKNQNNVLNYFRFSLGHIQNHVRQQGGNPSPYLVFSQKAALDMLDGDLDGMTIYGFGDQSEILVNDPLVQPIVNANPERNQHILLAADQEPARRVYNLAVGDSIKHLFNPLFASGSAEFKLINEYDYLNLTVRTAIATPKSFGLHSPGAGNYTRAFGFEGTQTIKNEINADDTGLVSDIEQIAGIYQNSQGCRLEVRPNGVVVLSQGTQFFKADIDRNFNDSMSRSSASSQTYLINITTPSESTPSFLQISTEGERILSAQHGRSLLDLPSMDQLSSIDLRCDF